MPQYTNPSDRTSKESKDKFKEQTQRVPSIAAPFEELKNIRVENLVGFTKVPLGLAGPLTIHGSTHTATVYGPLATLEATLVASCSRGCKAIQKSGGAHAVALAEGMARAPVFKFDTIGNAIAFYQGLHRYEAQFRENAECTSSHLKLVRTTPYIIGRCIHVRFEYACGGASGQNMTTIATHAAYSAFLKSSVSHGLGIIDSWIEGQVASDKKASSANVINTRGVSVIAWATLTDETCRTVLGISAERFYQIHVMGAHSGIRIGMQGSNCNTANILAAMFIACGQDAASVFEAGWSHGVAELDKHGNLVVSIFFPSMPVGTVGGGVMHPTQMEALGLIECVGPSKKFALAETIACFALALELSTTGAVDNDTFAASHKRLARL